MAITPPDLCAQPPSAIPGRQLVEHSLPGPIRGPRQDGLRPALPQSEAIFNLVELRGFEPLTPSMPWKCATSCATAPDLPRGGPPEGTAEVYPGTHPFHQIEPRNRAWCPPPRQA